MDNRSIGNRFRSILYVLIHFSCSLIQLACVFAILGLQITLTVTETCAYRIGVGFWSAPFLLAAPISIWMLIWKQNAFYCFIAFIIHIFSTLLASTVIIISFIALIGQVGSPCSTSSSSNNYFLSINISLIGVTVLFKSFIYAEIIVLYMLQRYIHEQPILDSYEKNYRIISEDVNNKAWDSFGSIITKQQHSINDIDV
ncbi:unnamed protein product [Rotaria socialis]|uniref:Uncharacterized protein n=1 Tax=Rotaria socialis TaxID=392032 RepID=A0A817V4G3_9BILA|nr:unnamed protein product [Rotaria socialis]CAF3337802.1 unnamed protein product [Rotaria socialis]CAF3453421.1 unnamed protein product [Rotaria socialis]CAF3456854.1 unnamed protein product [Rotaria socialis]CAF3469970.1 unnamed protein product [Rotaria socialis]